MIRAQRGGGQREDTFGMVRDEGKQDSFEHAQFEGRLVVFASDGAVAVGMAEAREQRLP